MILDKSEIVKNFRSFLEAQDHINQPFIDAVMGTVRKIVMDMGDDDRYINHNVSKVFLHILNELDVLSLDVIFNPNR